MDRAVLRAGAGAAVVGSALGLVFNVLHPRGSGVGVTDELILVADSPIWLFDHYMLFWAVALSIVGLVTIALSLEQEPARSWGRIAAATAVAGGAITLAAVLADGMATFAAAEEYAQGRSAQALSSGTAVLAVTGALFTGIMVSFFGVTPVLYGLAILSSTEFPKGLGYLAIGSGLLGLVTGSIQFMNGLSTLTANLLFPISSLAFTLFVLVTGALMWKRTAEPVPTTAKGAVA